MAVGIPPCVCVHKPFEEGTQPPPDLVDEELETQGGKVTCLGSHRSKG